MTATPSSGATPAAPRAAAPAPAREALRQQQLLRSLWRREATDESLAAWLHETGDRAAQGIAAYRGNAAALVDRALAAAYPTVRELVGFETFALLARSFWHHRPPPCGDLARYGAELADAIAGDAQLASEPYLADMARIDWAAHALEHAADVASPPPGLERLSSEDPAHLRLVLRPGLLVLRSTHPVVTLWQAHRSSADDDAGGATRGAAAGDAPAAARFAAARAAFARGDAETALVSRPGWRATVQQLDPPDARFFEALQRGEALAPALDAAGDGFAFERWLRGALAQRWLCSVEAIAVPG